MGNRKSSEHGLDRRQATSLIWRLIEDQMYVKRKRNSLSNRRAADNKHTTQNNSFGSLKHGRKVRISSAMGMKRYVMMLNQRGRMGMTPLHLACELGQTSVVHILLHLGVDPCLSTTTNHGRTNALILAAAGGHADCVYLLLQFNADIHQTDIWGNTALFKACCYNFVECVEVLLQNGANPNKLNKWGALPLQYAALQGHHEVLRLLVEHGADVQMWGEETVPQALTAAAGQGHVECVELLIKNGAPVNIAGNCNNQTPLHAVVDKHYCSDRDLTQCLKILLNEGAMVTGNVLKSVHLRCLCGGSRRGQCTFLETLLSGFGYHSDMEGAVQLMAEELVSRNPYSDCASLLTLLHNIGYSPKPETFRQLVLNNPRATFSLEDTQKLLSRFSNARSLKDICRIKLRGVLQTSIHQKTEQLPLPTLLKDFIRLVSSNSCS